MLKSDAALRTRVQSIAPSSHPGNQPADFAALGAAVLTCAAQAVIQNPDETAKAIPNHLRALGYALVSEGQWPKYKPARVKDPARCMPDSYPRAAERVGAEGVTVLEYTVTSGGRQTGVAVVQSSGDTAAHKLLDYSAALSGTGCTFEPAEENDRPVPGRARLEVIWKLQ